MSLFLRPLRPLLIVLAVASGVATLAACDSVIDAFVPDTITFDGVELEALGDASFRLSNDQLLVTNIGASGNDGVAIRRDASAYLKFAPIDLPDGGTFGLAVKDADDRFVASVFSEEDGSGRHDIVFDVADRFGVQNVTLQYLLLGEVIAEIPNVSLRSDVKRLKAATSGGSGDGENGSVRVVRVGGRYVVGQDYSGNEPTPLTGKQGCAYATITLPTPVGNLTEVCADLVQIVIEDSDLPDEIGGAEITGARLGQFAITSVQVED